MQQLNDAQVAALAQRPLELDYLVDESAPEQVISTKTDDDPQTTIVHVPASQVEVGDLVIYMNDINDVRPVERISLERDGASIVIYLAPDGYFDVTPDAQIKRVIPVEIKAVEIGHVPGWLKSFGQVPLRDLADETVARVVAENRRRVPVKLGSLTLDHLGDVSGPTLPRTALSDHAYHQLQMRAPSGTRSPRNVASWLCQSGSEADLRIMDVEGIEQPLAFAAVSARYTEMDIHQIADLVARALPVETQASLKYHGDGGRWSLTCSLSTEWEVEEREGQKQRFVPQLLVRGADDGSRSLDIRFRAVRWACTNGMISAKSSCARTIRHIGDEKRIMEQLASSFASVDRDVEEVSKAWSQAYGSVWRGDVGDKVEPIEGLEALRRLCAHGLLPTNGRRRHTVWQEYKAAFEAEPGDSVADVINAVTRRAHEGAITASGSWTPSPWAQEDAEEGVDSLLYQHVSVVLPALTEQMVPRFEL